ncbi:hypothetical protein EWM84_23930 [Escherichia coli]|nr:hypothetical protein [Escherichia coli]
MLFLNLQEGLASAQEKGYLHHVPCYLLFLRLSVLLLSFILIISGSGIILTLLRIKALLKPEQKIFISQQKMEINFIFQMFLFLIFLLPQIMGHPHLLGEHTVLLLHIIVQYIMELRHNHGGRRFITKLTE